MTEFAIGFVAAALLLAPLCFCGGAIYGAHRLALSRPAARETVDVSGAAQLSRAVAGDESRADTDLILDLSKLPRTEGGRLVIVRRNGHVTGTLDLDGD